MYAPTIPTPSLLTPPSSPFHSPASSSSSSSVSFPCPPSSSSSSLGDVADSGCCHLGMTRAAKRWIKHWAIHGMPGDTHTLTHTHSPSRHSWLRLRSLFLETTDTSPPTHSEKANILTRVAHEPLSTPDPSHPTSPFPRPILPLFPSLINLPFSNRKTSLRGLQLSPG